MFASSLAMRMEIGVFFAFLKNKRLPYFKKISASSKHLKVQITNVLVNFLSVRPLIWGVATKVLGKMEASIKCQTMMYKAVVQAVIMYGS